MQIGPGIEAGRFEFSFADERRENIAVYTLNLLNARYCQCTGCWDSVLQLAKLYYLLKP